MDDEALRALVQAGLAAPSAENRHALRFEAHAGGLDLIATDTDGWREQPHRAWLARMACGAVVENLLLTAAEQGRGAELRWLPQADRPDHLVRLHWRGRPGPVDSLAAQISQRHTNRRFYRREPLPAQALDAIAAAVRRVPGQRLVWLDGAALRRTALCAIGLAERQRFSRRHLHAELFGGIRFDQGWQGTVEEGLPPAALEVEAPLRPGFALMRHWPLMRGLSLLGAHRLLALRSAQVPCALSPHLGLLVSDAPPSAVGMLQAGRALQRAWLAATQAQAAFQPMAAPLALALQRPGDGWVQAGVQHRLVQLLEDLLDCARAPEGQPMMLFRLGRARAPSAVAARPDAADHLVLHAAVAPGLQDAA